MIAYVFMPEHVHLLVQPMSHDARIDLLLKAIKAPFSARIRKRLEEAESPLLETLTVRERPDSYRFRFWQEGGGYDRNLRSVKAVEAAIAYIHENPARRGLCERPADGRWSSARHYQNDGQSPEQSNDPPTVHGLTWNFYV